MVRVLYSRASEAAGNQRIPQRSKPGVSPVSRIRPRPTIFVWVNYILVLQSGHPGYLQITSDLYCVIICCVSLSFSLFLDGIVRIDNSRLFHNVGIAWYVVRAENCVLTSVCGRLLF